MWWGFTYINDIFSGIRFLMNTIPDTPETLAGGDSPSPVSQWRIVNIGKVRLKSSTYVVEEADDKKPSETILPRGQLICSQHGLISISLRNWRFLSRALVFGKVDQI